VFIPILPPPPKSHGGRLGLCSKWVRYNIPEESAVSILYEYHTGPSREPPLSHAPTLISGQFQVARQFSCSLYPKSRDLHAALDENLLNMINNAYTHAFPKASSTHKRFTHLHITGPALLQIFRYDWLKMSSD
jgi:hypothetical protein